MLRKSKQQAPSVTSPGQPYGIAGEQQAAMKTIPLPDSQIMGEMDTPISGDAGASMPGSETEPNSMQAAIQAALMSPSPDQAAFSAPTNRPNESIFTPSPMSTARPTDLGNIFRALAEDSGGDPVFLQLAAQADEQRL